MALLFTLTRVFMTHYIFYAKAGPQVASEDPPPESVLSYVPVSYPHVGIRHWMEASLSDCHNSALQQCLHSDLQSTKICQEEHTFYLFSSVAKLQNTLPLVCT